MTPTAPQVTVMQVDDFRPARFLQRTKLDIWWTVGIWWTCAHACVSVQTLNDRLYPAYRFRPKASILMTESRDERQSGRFWGIISSFILGKLIRLISNRIPVTSHGDRPTMKTLRHIIWAIASSECSKNKKPLSIASSECRKNNKATLFPVYRIYGDRILHRNFYT